MFVDVIRKLHELYPTELNKIAEEINYTDINNHGGEGYVWIADHIYLYTATSTMSKIRNLTKLFNECDVDKELLKFRIYL